jgi:hypothetical protein
MSDAGPTSLGHVLKDQSRLEALAQSSLMDSPIDESFDRHTRLLIEALLVPLSLVTLVSDNRQFFKSQIGLPQIFAEVRQSPLSHSFCQHVVWTGKPLQVKDARELDLTKDNLAIPDFGIIAYLGFPIIDEKGFVLGSVSVADTMPRSWSERECRIVGNVCEGINKKLELRAQIRALQEAIVILKVRESTLEKALRDKEGTLGDLPEAQFALLNNTF